MQRPLALSTEDFRALAHSLSDFTADYLERLPTIRSYPENVSGGAIEQLFSGEIPQEGVGGAAFDLLPEIFENSRPASPRFFGYVFGSGEPIAALGQFAAAIAGHGAEHAAGNSDRRRETPNAAPNRPRRGELGPKSPFAPAKERC